MSDDPIERLRAHVEKHRHHQQAFFSTAGLMVLLDLLDTQARQFREFVERDADDAIELSRQRDELKAQVERLLAKEGNRIEKALVPITRKDGGEPCGECRIQPGETCDICGAVSKELRKDANGNDIPWAKEHDYFMGFDPDNPDVPVD